MAAVEYGYVGRTKSSAMHSYLLQDRHSPSCAAFEEALSCIICILLKSPPFLVSLNGHNMKDSTCRPPPLRAQFFHNMSRETLSELSSLATFRKVIMHEKLASQGDDVTAVFFVFRGECITREPTQDGKVEEQRYGPGHIVGW